MPRKPEFKVVCEYNPSREHMVRALQIVLRAENVRPKEQGEEEAEHGELRPDADSHVPSR